MMFSGGSGATGGAGSSGLRSNCFRAKAAGGLPGPACGEKILPRVAVCRTCGRFWNREKAANLGWRRGREDGEVAKW